MNEEQSSESAAHWYECLAGELRYSLPVRAWWIDVHLPAQEGGVDQWVADLRGTDLEREKVRTAAFATLAEAECLASRRIVRGLAHALHGGDVLEEQVADEVVIDTARVWPSGCHALDERYGGILGLTTIAGHPGVGKSFLALGAAIEQAKLGHLVIYVNTELPKAVMYNRIRNYVRDPELGYAIASYLKICHVGAGISPEMLLDWIREKVNESEVSLATKKLCVVIDSVNRIAQLNQGDGTGYFAALQRWSNWGRVAAKDEPGLNWIEVNELSRSGEEKGAMAGYAADMSIRITKTDVAGCMHFEVPKSRYGEPGVIGRMFLDHETGTFVRPQ